ncbi:MAG TPA: thioredoxin domain-containing protein [Burkholderiales bacterium]
MTHTNRLVHETSPYLLQHAHNPVDWYPWGEEALERARREDKPILLSIGYSACHWCHVMERESFEDEDVARVMNEHYVCIKVDREERPDLDKVYQTAHQLLAQRPGGWPLTVFLTPDDHLPFFAGTYFPKEPRYGMPGFVDVLERVARAWHEQREAIRGQNAQLAAIFARIDAPARIPKDALDARPLAGAREELRAEYDADYGGFGDAPKFPQPMSLELLLRAYVRSTRTAAVDREARAMVRGTLRAMAYGGVYDQVGGGFYRYSVDRFWAIPHFEKMLYDNAQLLALYAEAARVLDEPLFARIAAETGEWVMREMQAPEGGYYSSLDADSEGREGKYYVWTLDELRAAVDPEEYAVLERRLGLHRPANFEGRWHLNVYAEAPDIAAALGLAEAEVERRLASARAKLYAFRERRVRPALDDKILAGWNALMIKGMARAGRLLGREDFIDSAQRALDFVRAALWRDGRLLATARNGRAQLNAYLDDHALLIEAALELLKVRWRRDDLAFAVALAHRLLDGFEDRTAGGFYFTSNDHEPLVHRPKPASDDALPAGNGVAARALLALGHVLGDVDFLAAAERTLRAHYARLAQYPSAHCTLLMALEQYLEPPTTVVLRGTPEALRAWQTALTPDTARDIYPIPADEPDLPGLLAERKPLGGPTAYVCRGHTCRPPVTDLAALKQVLAGDTL